MNATRVFGSPGFEIPKEGVLCEMSSSYPSLKESPTLTQGGVMLIKLAEPLPSAPLEFVYVFLRYLTVCLLADMSIALLTLDARAALSAMSIRSHSRRVLTQSSIRYAHLDLLYII